MIANPPATVRHAPFIARIVRFIMSFVLTVETAPRPPDAKKIPGPW
jgi:hypothetical protein